MNKVTIQDLLKKKREGRKLTMLIKEEIDR
jgi:hypothetical protein